MIYIYLSDTERSRKGFMCQVIFSMFSQKISFFLKQHILISIFSYICRDNHIHLSRYQMTILHSSFPILLIFIIAVSCFSSAGHNSPGFLSHFFPPFEVLSYSASGRVQRVVCVRRNGEYGREEFSISCRKFLIKFVKSVLSVFPLITGDRNTVHHRQEEMLLF